MYTGFGSTFASTHGYSLKIAYMFLADFLRTPKNNMGKGGPRSLQRDMEGHKDVIYQVW